MSQIFGWINPFCCDFTKFCTFLFFVKMECSCALKYLGISMKISWNWCIYLVRTDNITKWLVFTKKNLGFSQCAKDSVKSSHFDSDWFCTLFWRNMFQAWIINVVRNFGENSVKPFLMTKTLCNFISANMFRAQNTDSFFRLNCVCFTFSWWFHESKNLKAKLCEQTRNLV